MTEAVLGVLASGRGTNLQSIINAIATGQIKGRIGVVITDKPEAKALDRAREANIQAVQSFLEELRYGTVTLVVQDGKLIQIEKHEKVRLV